MKDELTDLIKRYSRTPEFLRTESMDPNQRGMTGDTLLHAAAVQRDLRDIQVLLECGANVNGIGDLGNTPLHYAASRGFENVVQILLQHGADRGIKNDFGQTASDLAKLNGHQTSARLLERTRSNRRRT